MKWWKTFKLCRHLLKKESRRQRRRRLSWRREQERQREIEKLIIIFLEVNGNF